ncbi:MAG: acyloxyacyl hydrolase [Bacteroidales bacterium]|nr:acyloxyacyl hydrolase [Bacteroidales bacterium]
MKKHNYFLVILCFLLINLFTISEAAAGNKKESSNSTFSIDSLMKNMEIDLRLNYGMYMHHHYEMEGYRAHFPMFELSLQKQTYGKSYWQTCFNYPAIGVTLFASGMGNIDVLGKAFALYPYIYFPFIKGNTNFGIRFGLGLGYLTESYDHVENPYNICIGSSLNAAASITFDITHRFSDRFKMSIFGGLQHFSNGCTSEPNKGTNVIKGGISAAYMINEPETYIKAEQLTEKMTIEYLKEFRPELYAGLSYGYKRIDYLQKDYTSVYDFEIYVMEQITRLFKLGVGFDLIYDETNILRNIKNGEEWTTYQIMNPGFHAAGELLMGKTSFMFVLGKHIGDYMYTKENYQRLALKIEFTKHFYGKVTLNVHQWHIADYLCFGLGFKL